MPTPPPPGPGRPKGLPNKATSKAREAIAAFVDDNAHRLTEWLDAMAIKDPKQAFDCFQSVIEYHIPKLQRTTIEGDSDKPLSVSVIERIVKDPKNVE